MASNGEVLTKAARVRAMVLDVDGVLTDAGLYYGPHGESMKRFSARDGFGIAVARHAGLAVAVLSGRVAPPLKSRLRDLGIPPERVIQGSTNKADDIDRLAHIIDTPLEAIAFMGDDVPDLPVLLRVGLAACPADAAPEVIEVAHLVCRARGGSGAVRELAETLLRAQGRWEPLVAAWREGTPPPVASLKQ